MVQEPSVTRPRFKEAEVSGSVSISGKESAAVPTDGSSAPGLSFTTWRTPSADRPVLVTVSVTAQTDGAADALVNFEVDEDGGTSRDYFGTLASAPSEANSGEDHTTVSTFLVPPGGSYEIVNAADPNGGNDLDLVREFEL